MSLLAALIVTDDHVDFCLPLRQGKA